LPCGPARLETGGVEPPFDREAAFDEDYRYF
jgi:hypothetical protein